MLYNAAMNSTLFAWLGRTDIRAMTEPEAVGLGPIAHALTTYRFAQICLLSNYPEKDNARFAQWLKSHTSAPIEIQGVMLTSPTDYGEIYHAATAAITRLSKDNKKLPDLWFHLSPGTPAMAAVWIILAKTRFSATLIESSKEQGVKVVNLPFDISAEFLPDLLRHSDDRFGQLSAGLPPEAPEFDEIIHRSSIMKDLIVKARRVAPRSVSILIEGESGTGKELFARAIHRSSMRRDMPFLSINCGAIPAELVESELFGHKKGAFTGANVEQSGIFIRARGGTVFLDEVGELPLPAQVKLLRVLQEGTVTMLGGGQEKKVDVRFIAATNRNLLTEVASRRFREDLFYRLAVAVLVLPPLRERPGDLGLLIDSFLRLLNEENLREQGLPGKKLSPSARNELLKHPWPGNVRELKNTLCRAVLWSNSTSLDVQEIKEALLPVRRDQEDQILGRSLGPSLDLKALLSEVAGHYLVRALREAGGNKSKAAELVGLPSYQTLTNWLQKYNVRWDD